jgi:ABC-type lipoprotein release transport system permease subunit
MGRLLFDITPSDPVTLAAVAAGLFGVAAAASLLPALRATRVDPVSVLRID